MPCGPRVVCSTPCRSAERRRLTCASHERAGQGPRPPGWLRTDLLQLIRDRIERRLGAFLVLVAGAAAHADGADVGAIPGLDGQATRERGEPGHESESRSPARLTVLAESDLAEPTRREREHG